MLCPECGFRLDPFNDSQAVCPACGANPNTPVRPNDDFSIAGAFEDGEAFAEAPATLSDVLDFGATMEPEIDYVPDPELDLAIADGEALMHALTEGPILVAGNRLIN